MICLAIILCLLTVVPRFVNYSAADGLPSNTVYAITQDTDRVLWVGTRNGLASFDGSRFRSYKEYGRVNALTVDTEGRLWVGTTEGLTVMPDQAGHDGAKVGHDGGPVRALYADKEGFVWATVGDTLLLKLSYHGGIREEARCFYDKRDHEGDYPYFQIYEASDGKLWLSGRLVHNQYVEDRKNPQVTLTHWEGLPCNGSYAETGGKLYSFEDHTSLLHTYEAGQPIPIGRLPISHARLLTDHSGNLWAAGSYGLGLVNTRKPEETKVYKTASNELYCIFEDRQGNIWAGGDNGLSVLSSALQQVRVVSTAQVSALMEDHNGKLWIGTAQERVSALYEDRSGTVYVGFWNNTGWEVWKGGKKAYKDRLTGELPKEQTEARHLDGANWISDFLEDSEGRFWVVTWEGVGLNEWDRKARRSLPPRWLSPFRYPYPQVDSNIYVSSRLGSRIIEDRDGNLVYATTEAGLNVIDRKTGLVTKYFKGNSSIPDDYVTDLCLTPDGAVWAATRSGLWSPSGNHFLDGMLVQSVEADEKGRLWAGTEDGLWFIDTDGSTGRVPKELGFPSDIYGERVSCHLSGGLLAFGGAAGAVSFHPDSLLSIKAAGNLPLESLIRHRCRINGGEWTEGRFIGLPENIRPGRYVLQEQCSDIFGRWDHGETSEKTLRVPPPLWLRWPFLLLYALLLTGIVWTVLRLRERRLLVKELEMRNRLFSIISHDLRNPISGNRLLSRQLLERLPELPPEKLREGLEKLAVSADNTSSLLENLLLWSLNQKGMLEPVMREEDLPALAAEAIGTIQKGEIISVDIPSGLTVKTDRNMLLTCLRNLLDNAVKASPDEVILKARGNRISITDNGPGLREGDPHWGHGLGLVITRELLDKLGAKMTMNNRPEGGLQITIDL
ncbi:MAG: hypothetical protein IK113_07475 [Bacteroidales bacterium]|nr:hypothetical protein [Bacteroidales bacterium]